MRKLMKNLKCYLMNMLHSTLKFISIGGQYLDGTTDVTRTFHYGTPKPFEIEVDMSTVVEYSAWHGDLLLESLTFYAYFFMFEF